MLHTERATSQADLPHDYRATLTPRGKCHLCGRLPDDELHIAETARELAAHHGGLRLVTEKGS